MVNDADPDENDRLNEQLKKLPKDRVVPHVDQPGPPLDEGEATPNPLPDNPHKSGEGGGDPGRT